MFETPHALSPERRALLALRIRRQKTGQPNTGSEISPRRPHLAPLSHGQRSIWLTHQLSSAPGLEFTMAFSLQGPLQVEGLRWSLEQIVHRHEVLRSRILVRDGEPVQEVLPPTPWELAVEETPGSASSVLQQEFPGGFDLEAGEVLRTRLLRLGKDDHVFVVAMHHIAVDGWSCGVLAGELALLYRAWCHGFGSPLPPLEVQYADYATWQKERLSGDSLRRLEEFWTRQLDGAQAIDLPADFPRRRLLKHGVGRTHVVSGAELTAGLRALSQDAGVTLFMTLLAAWLAILSLWSGKTDLVVATFVADRGDPKVQKLIGFFVNTVLLRVDVSGNPLFSELLGRVKKTALGAYANQELPIEYLLKKIQSGYDLNRGNPLLQHTFGVQTLSSGLHLPGLQIEPLVSPSDTLQGEAALQIYDDGRELISVLEYSVELWKPATMERLLRIWREALPSIVANPHRPISELRRLPQSERQSLLKQGDQTRRPCPQETIVRQFEAQAERTPEAVAVIADPREITYRSLNAEANQLAQHLRQSGIQPGAIVAICLDRGAEMLIALLGVLKAGAAYLPLYPGSPAARTAYVLSNSGAQLIIADRRVACHFDDASIAIAWWDDLAAQLRTCETQVDLPAPQLAGLAYVIYTSGSTGEPKGVLVAHASLANALQAFNEMLALGSSDSSLALTALSFDIAGLELFLPLLSGGRVIIVPEATRADGAVLSEFIRRTAPTLIQATPSTFELLKAVRWSPPGGVRLLSGGEAIQAPLAEHLCVEGSDLWNMYGPTETTIWSSAAKISRDYQGNIPIGRPIANTQIYVLGEDGEPVQEGLLGEIAIGGAGLAWGYMKQARLTAAAFVPDGLSGCRGGRVYRTGDLGRWCSDGQLEFVGRSDNQIKLRGHRIELSEIETVLKRQPGVASCAVLQQNVNGRDGLLVAFVVPVPGTSPPRWRDLSEALSKLLPPYMLPNAMALLPAMPLTPSGKIDRRALMQHHLSLIQGMPYVAPETRQEEAIARAWKEVLQVERVGRDDNFFDLGGHSLLAIKAGSQLEAQGWGAIPVQAVFEFPTVSKLANWLSGRAPDRESMSAVPQRARDGVVPLSYAQERMFFLAQLQQDSAAYQMTFGLKLKGALNKQALAESFHELVRRHEILRTRFLMRHGEPVAEISNSMEARIEEIDLRQMEETEHEVEFRRQIQEEVEEPFDLGRGPLVRVRLLQSEEDTHLLLVNMHHIIADEWSMAIVMRELSVLYSAFSMNAESPLLEPATQYADYAIRQRDAMQGAPRERLLHYWKKQLHGIRPMGLPSDISRLPCKVASGGSLSFQLPAGLVYDLKELIRQEGASLFMGLLASFQVLLAKHSGQNDIAVGSPVANRHRAETQRLVGFLSNMLVFRTDLSGDPNFREILRRVRDVALAAYEHQDLPFEILVEALQPTRRAVHPLVQAVFSMHTVKTDALQLRGLEMQHVALPTRTDPKFDLLLIIEDDDQLCGQWEYDARQFSGLMIQQINSHFRQLLASIVRDPWAPLSQLQVIPDEELKVIRHRPDIEEFASSEFGF